MSGSGITFSTIGEELSNLRDAVGSINLPTGSLSLNGLTAGFGALTLLSAINWKNLYTKLFFKATPKNSRQLQLSEDVKAGETAKQILSTPKAAEGLSPLQRLATSVPFRHFFKASEKSSEEEKPALPKPKAAARELPHRQPMLVNRERSHSDLNDYKKVLKIGRAHV